MTVGAWGRASSRFRDLLRSACDRLAVLGAGGGGGGGLIVRLDAIGDFLLWLPEAKALRGRAGGGRVVLLANQSWADLARSLPYWDEVWPVDVKRFRAVGPYRWALLRRLRAAGFGTALQPAFSRDYSSGDAAIWASG
ncbi:MAG TPA: hypothetical protein VNZ54_07660, partial [bacterium]|nr:hypothetical protein [bacterium]